MEIPFAIRADAPLQGFEFSIDFDETRLRVVDVLKRWRRPDGLPYDFAVFRIDNEDENPGGEGTDEGFVAGRALIEATDPAVLMPAGEDVEALTFVCDVSTQALPGNAHLQFAGGAVGAGIDFASAVFAGGERFAPAAVTSFAFVDGAVTVLPPGPLFIRGDANADGAVSFSDVRFMLNYFFLVGTEAPPCLESGDVDGDGAFDISDPIAVFRFLVAFPDAPPPVAPFPDPGPDLDEDDLDCRQTGTGAPIEDPVALVELTDAVVPGGEDAGAAVTIRISASRPVGGLAVTLTSDQPIFSAEGAAFEELLELPGPENRAPFSLAVGAEDRIRLGYLPALTTSEAIPSGEGIEAGRIHFCLAPGTPAGEYTLTLKSAEFADMETGQTVVPALGGGTLRVLADVDAGASCPPERVPSDRPRNIEFRLGEAAGGRGDRVGIPFSIRADRASQGFEFSVDFDEGVLRALDIVKRWRRPDGTSYDFEAFEVDNDDRVPGNDGVDEGFLVGAAIVSLTDSASVLPPDEDIEVLSFVFLIGEDAPAGETPVRFLDGAAGSGGPVGNNLIASGERITPHVADSFVFVDGHVSILPDGALFVFLRGDANGDLTVDIADATFTLSYLFLGGSPPRCLDAADANDDGLIDISDALATLGFLFGGTASLPPPVTEPGIDSTPDGLSCSGEL